MHTDPSISTAPIEQRLPGLRRALRATAIVPVLAGALAVFGGSQPVVAATALDTSFGEAGIAALASETESTPSHLTVDASGRTVLVLTNASGASVVRLDADGDLDETFAEDGSQALPEGFSANDLAVSAAGIAVAGVTQTVVETDPGSDGGTDGGATDGEADGGATDGATDGGATDGEADGGATDGATDGEADGGTTDGEADGGTTDGEADGGATDGGTTDGSTTDGGMVAASELPPVIDLDWAVVRLADDGSYLTTFDTDGILAPSDVGASSSVDAVAVDAAGNVLVTTSLAPTTGAAAAAALVRVLPDGTLDEEFGEDGGTDLAAVADAVSTEVHDLAVDAAGNIDVVVSSTFAPIVEDLGSQLLEMEETTAVVRVLPTGALDEDFGADGVVDLGSFEATDVEVSPFNGQLLVGGTVDGDVVVRRVTTTGNVDGSFGKLGTATIPSKRDGAVLAGLVALPTGQVLAASSDAKAGESASALNVRLLSSAGLIEPSFGTGGELVVSGATSAAGLAVRDHNGVLVAGAVDSGTSSEVRAYTADIGPSAAAIASVTPQRAGLSVTWTAPEHDGGSPVVSYLVLARHGAELGMRVVSGDVRQVTIPSLVNGTAYDVVVVPYNRHAAGAWSTSMPGTPSATAPANAIAGAAQDIETVRTKSSVTATWSPPAFDGGRPILGYTVFVIDQRDDSLAGWRTVAADVRSASVAGLVKGVAYDVHVIATSEMGFGSFGEPLTVIGSSTAPAPQTPVVPWVAAGPSGAAAVVTWGAATERGEVLTRYNVVVMQGGVMKEWTTTAVGVRSIEIDPITAGVPAQVYAFATSASGLGPIGVPVTVVLG
jgi:hypothetical protein